MIVGQVVALVVLPALTFALLYFPALTKLSAALASPYPKVDWRRRLLAAAIDGSLLAMMLYFAADSRSVAVAAAGGGYLALRDGVYGRSVGKFAVSLVAVGLTTGRPCSIRGSLTRNLVFLFPGVNIVAVVLEAVTVHRDSYGQRLGDRLARTQVVEGFGARELVASLSRWWFSPTPSPRHRRPARAPEVAGRCVRLCFYSRA